MPRISFAFFAFGALCGLAGIVWGIHMGGTRDETMMLPHAHLNLLGWVSSALMGGFYALAKQRVPAVLAWVNFALWATGAVTMPIAMAYLLLGDQRFVPLVIFGSFAALLGMACFLAAVLVAWRRNSRTDG